MSDNLEQIQSGVMTYKVGGRTIYDTRNAVSGRYEDTGLKGNDIVIWSDKKVYRAVKGGEYSRTTFVKMNKQEIIQLTNEIDDVNSGMKSEIFKNTIMGAIKK